MAILARMAPQSTSVEKLGEEVKRRIFSMLKRSLYVLRVDTGSCNGCEIEIFAALSPLYDVERFGIKLVVSPRHADALLVTGPVTRQYRPVLERVYRMTPDPKVVIAIGACACGGGVWYNSFAVEGGVDQVIPVDVYVPGCPPHPVAILQGILVALDVLKQKIEKISYREEKPEREWKLRPPLALLFEKETPVKIPWELYKDIVKTARKYLGYLYGARLVKDYLALLDQVETLDELKEASKKIVEAWNRDPRIAQVVEELNKLVEKYFARKH